MNQVVETISQVENVLINGDLSKLSDKDKLFYYNQVCNSVGLNPLTRPFEYIMLNRKLTLYAKRDCTDQLRQIHGVSIKVLHRGEVDGQYEVHVAAQDKHGRTDEDIGAVPIAGLRGDARSNAIAKAMTKAKRRVTLSICGLGLLDETEASDIPGTQPVSYNLDKIFPKDDNDKAIEAPQIADTPPPDTKAPKIEEASPEAPEASTGNIPLTFLPDMDQSNIDYESSREFYTEYEKQLVSISGDENFPERERMTRLREFEELNQISLEMIPAAGTEKLKKKRTNLNRKLGVKK